MSINRPKKILLHILVAVVALGAVSLAVWPAASQAKGDSLATKRAQTAARVFKAVAAEYATGQRTLEDVHVWSTRWLDAQLAGATKAARKRAFAAHHERMTTVQKKVRAKVDAGMAPATAALEAEYFAVEAEGWQKALSRDR